MSPTENDLRAALHNGEGDPVNADVIIAEGQARRAQRRTRLLGGTAVVAFVAAAATGGALLAGNNNDSAGAGKNADGNHAAAPAAGGGGNAGAASRSDGAACPSRPAKHSLGNNSSSSGAGGRLFPKPVNSLVLCGYTVGPNVTKNTQSPSKVVVQGDVAQQLVDSLENAPRTRPHVMCPDYRIAGDRTLEIIGVTSGGATLTPVTVDLSGPACSNTVTNGTAVRYAWSPSTSLTNSIAKSLPGGSGSLNPGGGGGAPPAVHKSGSPVK